MVYFNRRLLLFFGKPPYKANRNIINREELFFKAEDILNYYFYFKNFYMKRAMDFLVVNNITTDKVYCLVIVFLTMLVNELFCAEDERYLMSTKRGKNLPYYKKYMKNKKM